MDVCNRPTDCSCVCRALQLPAAGCLQRRFLQSQNWPGSSHKIEAGSWYQRDVVGIPKMQFTGREGSSGGTFCTLSCSGQGEGACGTSQSLRDVASGRRKSWVLKHILRQQQICRGCCWSENANFCMSDWGSGQGRSDFYPSVLAGRADAKLQCLRKKQQKSWGRVYLAFAGP